jgi:hypothetical protein
MRNHQIPPIIDLLEDIPHYMISLLLRGQQVTTPSIMAGILKRISDNPGKFTRD